MKKKNIVSSVVIITISIILIISYFLYKDKGSTSFSKHSTIITQVEKLGRLEVVKYNIQDIMEYKKIRRWLPNSNTMMKVAGEVIACIDLTRIGEKDIYTFKDSVSLILPLPEICSYKVDHSRSKVFNVEYGLWETAEIVDEAYAAAENHIYNEAIDMGIAKESQENTISVLTSILNGLGFNKIHIEFHTPADGSKSERQTLKIKK